MNKYVDKYVGKIYNTNNFGAVKLIEYFNSKNVSVEFKDGTILKNVESKHVFRGTLKNPNTPSVEGVGFLGIGKYSFLSNKVCYKYWNSILTRCYSYKYHKTRPTYIGCTVDERWHNFQNFAKWFEENYDYETMQGWCLDKDILVKGNKIYSPKTCCFVPKEINSIFTEKPKNNLPHGVVRYNNDKYISTFKKYLGIFDTPKEAFQAYKTAKEQYIKEVADKWKELISDKVYQAMYSYKVIILH